MYPVISNNKHIDSIIRIFNQKMVLKFSIPKDLISTYSICW